MFKNIAADIVYIIHVLVVLFMVCAPFMGNNERFLFILTVPFLFFHWIINDDTCALTMIECFLRGVPKDQSFLQRIVGPVYDPSTVHTVAKLYLIVAWVGTVHVYGVDNVIREFSSMWNQCKISFKSK